MKTKTRGAKSKLTPSNLINQEEGNGNSESASVGGVSSKDKCGVSVIRDVFSDRGFDVRHPERSICIVCNRPGGQVLVCSNKVCPLAIHEMCIDDPSFDENGNFYCPYCWYKLKLEQVEKTREWVSLAERNLLEFLKCNAGEDDDKHGEEGVETSGKGLSVSPVEEEERDSDVDNVADQAEKDVLSEGIKDKPVEAVRHSDDEVETTSVTNGTKGIVNGAMYDKEENHGLKIARKGDVGQANGGEQSTLGEEQHHEEGPDKVNEMEQQAFNLPNQEESKQNTVSDSKSDISDSETETPSLRMTRARRKIFNSKEVQNVKSGNKNCSATRRLKSDMEECSRNRDNVKDTRKKPRLVQGSPEKFSSTGNLNGRRKKLPWRPEEEEMLKEGVHKFSKAINKNIPWRKILEFGRHVFDPTRTPADLKDKWRNSGDSS